MDGGKADAVAVPAVKEVHHATSHRPRRRFTQQTYTQFFPTDWYEESPRELISKKPASEIREFFEAKLTPQLRLV